MLFDVPLLAKRGRHHNILPHKRNKTVKPWEGIKMRCHKRDSLSIVLQRKSFYSNLSDLKEVSCFTENLQLF